MFLLADVVIVLHIFLILVLFYTVEFVFHIEIHVLVHHYLQMLQTMAVFYMFDNESLIGQNYLSQVLIHKHITPLL